MILVILIYSGIKENGALEGSPRGKYLEAVNGFNVSSTYSLKEGWMGGN